MGTNYYLKQTACPHCGRGSQRGLHIGKSSAGWVFSLRVYDDDDYQVLESRLGPIRSLADWIPLFERFGVVDEYGKDLSAPGMIASITQRGHPNGLQHNRSSWSLSYEPVAGQTYDLVRGEFS